MTSTDAPAPAPAPVDNTKPNSFQRIVGVFASPAKTFDEIARRPDWVVPLLILVVISFATAWAIGSRLDYQGLAQQAMESNPRVADMPADQQARMVRFTATTMKVTTVIAPLLSIIGLLIIAGVCLLGVRAMGGGGNFAQAWSVAIYGWYPRLIKGILATIVLLNRKSLTIIDLQNPLRSNLGFLFDPKLHPVAFAFTSSFDIFAIWSLILYIIGFSAISRLSRGKTAAVILVLWVVVVMLTLIGPAFQAAKMK